MYFFTRLRFRKAAVFFVAGKLLLVNTPTLWAFAGEEGASFLEVPVGARPAAMGSAYTALADDAYAPVWNPAGLGFLESTQFAGMHQIYVDNTSFDYLSAVHTFKTGTGIGVSAQYFNPGKIDAFDTSGNALGSTFSGYYGAYSLALAQRLNDRFSLGMTGKLISAKIDDVTASTYAGDLGLLYKPTEKWNLAAVLANVGGKLKFLSQGDSLPQAFRLGAAYKIRPNFLLSLDGVSPTHSDPSLHAGVEWKVEPNDEDMGCAFRAGYSTDRTRNLSAMAGASLGVGAYFWGQELSYAFMPLSDFGESHYISLVLHFSQTHKKKSRAVLGDGNDNYEFINEMSEDTHIHINAKETDASPSNLKDMRLDSDSHYSKELYEK
jgi:hypothetical protein